MNKKLTNKQKRKKKVDKKRKKKAAWSEKCIERFIEESAKLAQENMKEATEPQFGEENDQE